jgi:hypothetical protein
MDFHFWLALALSIINSLLNGCVEHCVAKMIVVNCIVEFLHHIIPCLVHGCYSLQMCCYCGRGPQAQHNLSRQYVLLEFQSSSKRRLLRG